jgi:acyl phosphate:glycerol-3-phosphate acyltransferase
MSSLFLLIVLSYLMGSFPTALLVGKALRGIDIRKHGSGNAGGSNVFRVLGWKAGVFVMAVDIFKGFAATYWLPRLLPLDILALPSAQLMAGICAILGHIWTVFAGFRGGKGVGTAAGMLLALFPQALLVCFIVFAIMLLATRIVAAASIAAAIALPITLTLFRYQLNRVVPVPLYVFSFFAALLIIYTHRSNIRRLIDGTENRFSRPRKTS